MQWFEGACFVYVHYYTCVFRGVCEVYMCVVGEFREWFRCVRSDLTSHVLFVRMVVFGFLENYDRGLVA
jgi:hypothetical protein